MELKNALYTHAPILRGMYELEPLLSLVLEHDLFIAGGAARYMLAPHPNPMPYGDVDVWGFLTYSDFSKFSTHLGDYMKCMSQEYQFAEFKRYDRVNKSLLPSDPKWWFMPNVQLISRTEMFDSASNLKNGTQIDRIVYTLNHFDLTNSRAAVYFDRTVWDWRGIVWGGFYDAEREKVVDVEGVSVPYSTLGRIRKYRKHGYSIAPKAIKTIRAHARWLVTMGEHPWRDARSIGTGDNGFQNEEYDAHDVTEYGDVYYYTAIRKQLGNFRTRAELLRETVGAS